MKWSIPQLRKLDKPIVIDETVDINGLIPGFIDVKNISLVHVTGTMDEVNRDEYLCKLNIKTTLTMFCAISLEEVLYNMDVDTEELYTSDTTKEDANLIDGLTIDLVPAVISAVVVNKPYRVIKDGAINNFDEVIEDEDKIDPRLAKLKDFLKE